MLLIATLFAQRGERNTLEKVTLQLHWKYQFEFAGFIAAKEKGFYEDVGLDVTLKEYEMGLDIEADVLSGKANFGIYNSLSLLEYLRGKPLVLVSSYFKRAALVLVTAPDIKSPRDLVGKKIMASTKEDFELNFQPYFDGYGMSVEDVELVPHSYRVDEFAQGKVAAMTAFVSNELMKLDEKGVKYNVLDPSNDNLYVLQLELITSQNEAKQHPQRVEKFREASIKGWQYALAHKSEIVEIIYEKYSKRFTQDEIMEEAMGVERLILPYTYDIGSIDRNFLSKQISLFKNYYKVGEDKTLDDYIFSYSTKKDIHFTKKELNYIKQHPNISVCLQYDQFPIDGFKNGKFSGIAGDIYKKISEITSLKFQPLPSTSSAQLKQNLLEQKCQMLSLYGTKTNIYKTIKPTDQFLNTNFTFITTLDKSFIDDIATLKGKTLITQFQVYKDYMLHYYPELQIEIEEDKNVMVHKLLNKRAYALVTLDEEADYLINKYGYGKLKVNGFFPREYKYEGSIGVQKSEPILFTIIQKALHQIDPKEIESIINSWKIVHYKTTTDYTLVWKVTIFMGIIVLIMIYYQRKLRLFNKQLEKIVDDKTKELRKINESLEATVEEKIAELITKDEILTAQSKQAVMGEMISMIAHQWRQPLNTITLQISNLEIQKMIGNEFNEEMMFKTLKEISETIVYLSDTVDDFKTYFRPDKEASSVYLKDVIGKLQNFINARLKSKKINLVVKEYSDFEVKIYTNELIQVLLNILNNAIDAYEIVDKKRKTIEIEIVEDEKMVEIYIRDNATGISQKNIKQLFEPYFSTKGKNGTGLGLYMSKMIIEKQFSGEIIVKNIEDGAEFLVRFPKKLH